MSMAVFNRYEKKFMLDTPTYEAIYSKLPDHMELDEYNKAHGSYTISNIYYDTEDDYLIRNSLSKPDYKEKLRLRAYGVPDSNGKVFLEIKKNFDGWGNKRRTLLELKEAYDFVSTGIKPEFKDYMNKQVLNEIAYMLKIYKLEPKLYLAYDRKALFDKEKRNLRVTFDRDIRTRRYDLKLENGDYGESLTERGQYIMEIKAEKSIPLWLSKLLSEYRVYSMSFSKYGTEYQKRIMTGTDLKEERNPCSKQYSAQPRIAHQYRWQPQC